MKKNNVFLLFISCSLFLSGCVSTTPSQSSLIDQHREAVEIVFGPPDSPYEDLGIIKYVSEPMTFSTTLESVVNQAIPKLKKQAKSMGGNAIAITKNKRVESSMVIYARVLKVNWVDYSSLVSKVPEKTSESGTVSKVREDQKNQSSNISLKNLSKTP